MVANIVQGFDTLEFIPAVEGQTDRPRVVSKAGFLEATCPESEKSIPFAHANQLDSVCELITRGATGHTTTHPSSNEPRTEARISSDSTLRYVSTTCARVVPELGIGKTLSSYASKIQFSF